jgi:hypothetical protein
MVDAALWLTLPARSGTHVRHTGAVRRLFGVSNPVNSNPVNSDPVNEVAARTVAAALPVRLLPGGVVIGRLRG